VDIPRDLASTEHSEMLAGLSVFSPKHDGRGGPAGAFRALRAGRGFHRLESKHVGSTSFVIRSDDQLKQVSSRKYL
jgi:hypothetical protein